MDDRIGGGAGNAPSLVGPTAFAAAERLVGVRFRLQGRDIRHGLDCVGLIWAAYAAAGVKLAAPDHYPMRGWSAGKIIAALDDSGLARSGNSGACLGDVGLMALPAAQFHLAIIGQGHVVHAHAGLRRVVKAPFDSEWQQVARWRWAEG